jgi:DUF1365 family protein
MVSRSTRRPSPHERPAVVTGTGETAPLRSRLYEGVVMHQRLRPVRHRFRYRVFSVLLDLDELPLLDRRLRLLRIERPGVLSFRARDHGARDGSPLKPWAVDRFAAAGIGPVARVELLCFPRLWGYVFNPLSVYFAYGAGGDLLGVLYEVKNTFGGQHAYVLPADAATRGADGRIRHGARKSFYVSPFIDMAASYHFALLPPGETLELVIRETGADGLFFTASQSGRMLPLDDPSLLGCLFRNLAMTFKVIGGIHVEALRLWLKGAPYHPKAAEQIDG